MAENLRAKLPGSGYEIALLRERAELRYAEGDFDRAAEAAEQAYQRLRSSNGSIHRAEYCRSLRALALLRLGHSNQAQQIATGVARTLRRGQGTSRGFTPRIHQHLCIVFAHKAPESRTASDEGSCRKGLALAARRDKRETRDLVLGHLAYSEYWLKAGDLVRARESADQAIAISRRLFGDLHQDLATALTLLAAVDEQEGATESAGRRKAEAARILDRLFGADSDAAARLRRRFR
jgi:tetratricopeptide (TPR) repeat protein